MKLYKSGESHGKFMVGLITDVPYGIPVDENKINSLLRERNLAFGRSERQKKEKDKLFYLSGVANGKTTGNNVAVIIKNNVRTLSVYNSKLLCEGDRLDSKKCDESDKTENCCEVCAEKCDEKCAETHSQSYAPLVNLRPGHADMPGIVKYGITDARVISEGASARNTCLNAVAGAIALSFLSELNVNVCAFVRAVADVKDDKDYSFKDVSCVCAPYFSVNDNFKKRAKVCVKKAAADGESLGGEIELRISNIKAGLGGFEAEKRVSGAIARDLLEIQAVKGVYFGENEQDICLAGTAYADSIVYENGNFYASGKKSGGIDGGMTNGAEIVIKVKVKPLPTTKKGVPSVDVNGKPCVSQKERADITAVFALCPILKGVVALTLSSVITQSTGDGSLQKIKERYSAI